MSYQCPLCHRLLQFYQQQWCCCNNHQFDCAKEGYVNLLSVQHKGSKQPGDNPEMMRARRAFLDAGYYQLLQQRVSVILDNTLPLDACKLLDIGCGEGYYTAAAAGKLNQRRQMSVYGLDIAKIAIRYGAKRYCQINFCVASSHRLPFPDESLDAVLRIYAPCKSVELVRVIKPGGIVLTVSPGPRHLYQFKTMIYQQAKLHFERNSELAGFELVNSESLSYKIALSSEQRINLLQMTPFAWRTSIDIWQKLAALNEFVCETDFIIRLYRRPMQFE